MCQHLGFPIVLVVTILATSGETRSRGKVPGLPLDDAAGLNLHNGLDDCGEDSHLSCDIWAESGECEKNQVMKQSCSFSCSLSGQLWEAAWSENLSAVKTAIAAGANPLCPKTREVFMGYNFYNRPAIPVAARNNHPSVVQTLNNAGMNVNLQTNKGKTTTYEVSMKGGINALDILIKNNADDNISASHGVTPLIAAARDGQLSAVKALIKANANLDERGGSIKGTAIYHAVSEKNHGVVLLLIEHNANVNIPDYNGETPLIRAAWQGKLNIVMALINANASLDVTGGGLDATALYYAVRHNHQDVALLLIEHDANIDIPTSDGVTPLMRTSQWGQLYIAEALVNAYADIDVTGGYFNTTALYYAVRYNHQDVALLLMANNADVNIPRSDGMTALMSVAQDGRLGIANALINSNAYLDVTGGDSNSTALHYAVEENNQDMVLLLMDNGADSRITNKSGFTPGHLARLKGHIQLADLIESYPTTRGLILSR